MVIIGKVFARAIQFFQKSFTLAVENIFKNLEWEIEISEYLSLLEVFIIMMWYLSVL